MTQTSSEHKHSDVKRTNHAY